MESNNMDTRLPVYVFLILSCVSGLGQCAEICCPDVGCFTDGSPFVDLPLPECLDEIQPTFHLYTRRNREAWQPISREQIGSLYDGSKRTIIMVHGYMGDRSLEWMAEMRTVLLDHADYNVILVDWSDGAQGPGPDYPQAAANTRVIGAEIANIVQKLENDRGASRSNFYCVGHSLGSHVCGLASKITKLGRVTGLDPAGPLWSDNPPAGRLDKADADFVDCIHSHGDGGPILDFGIGTAIGDVDFFPNGGGMQPGCETFKGLEDTVACSHHRAIHYFTESIYSSCKFTSVPCDTYQDWVDGKCRECSGGDCNYLGFYAEDYKERTGVFVLNTRDKRPYCLN